MDPVAKILNTKHNRMERYKHLSKLTKEQLAQDLASYHESDVSDLHLNKMRKGDMVWMIVDRY